MKKIGMIFASTLVLMTSTVWACDYSTVDTLIEKELYRMAKRYDSKSVGMGVSIVNGNLVTTSIAIFQGRGGNDGILVDRIGSITVDLTKCAVHNTLVGTFDVLPTPN